MTPSLGLTARRFALDTAIGLAIFCGAMLAIAGGSNPAGAMDGSMLAFAEAKFLPLVMIGGVFSLVLAFNLALYRHIRRVYAVETGRQGHQRRQSGTSISP